MKASDFDHRCTDKSCCYFGKITAPRSCQCHMPREDMLLAEVIRLTEVCARQKRALTTIDALDPEDAVFSLSCDAARALVHRMGAVARRDGLGEYLSWRR